MPALKIKAGNKAKPVAPKLPVKPVAGKTATAPVKPVSTKPVKPVAAAVQPKKPGATSAERIARDDAKRFVTRQYPFNGTLSHTDEQYLSFFAAYAKKHNGRFSFAELAGAKPAGITIDNNAARAGRLADGGYISGGPTVADPDPAKPFTFTAKATSLSFYTKA